MISMKDFQQQFKTVDSVKKLLLSLLDSLPEKDQLEKEWQILLSDLVEYSKTSITKTDSGCNPDKPLTIEQQRRYYTFLARYIPDKRKRGPKSLLERENIPPLKVVRKYEQCGNSRDTAKFLGISHFTVLKILRDQGVKLNPPGFPKDAHTHRKKRKESALIKWVRKNPNTILPRDVDKIVALTHCTKDSVYSYFYGRKKKKLKKLLDLPDIREKDIKIEFRGRKIKSSDIMDYSFDVDQFTLQVTLSITLHSSEKVIIKNAKINNYL